MNFIIKGKKSGYVWIIIPVFALLVGGMAIGPKFLSTNYEKQIVKKEEQEVIEEKQIEKAKHIKIPEQVKAIYMTSCVVGTKDFRQELVDLIGETELNSIIIDIKDFSGTLSFPTQNEKWKYAWDESKCGTSDMKDFISYLHEKDIYVIGRITVFQDPLYTKRHPESAVKRASDGAVWKDHKGLSFIEVGAKDYWAHVVELAKESYELGFDEINFDYVRFPSDGNMEDIYFPHSNEIIVKNGKLGKQLALEEFFKYLDKELRADLPADSTQRPIISADLFGMTTTNSDDLNIGQVQERALPYFDFIAPMVYPSHYPNGFNGWANPNHYPYELIHFVMSEGVKKIENTLSSTTTPAYMKENVHKDQLRPWIQDFDYGGDYGPVEVREQIQAVYDVGLDSWMIWAPSNRYTREALNSD